MKNSVIHKVPLSTQAVEILLYVREQTGRSEGVIFPPERGGHHINSPRLSHLMRKLEIPAVPHGDRSSVRNWAGGRADIAQPAAEMVLGHKQSKDIEKTYMTSDFFEHRRPIMQEWADFLTQTMGPTIGDEQKPQEKHESGLTQFEERGPSYQKNPGCPCFQTCNSGWSMPGTSPDTISCAIDKKAGIA